MVDESISRSLELAKKGASHSTSTTSFVNKPFSNTFTRSVLANMKYSLPCLAFLASTVSSAAVDLLKRDTPLSVVLTHTEDSKVKVALTNNAETNYKLFYKESFLDDAPTDKLIVSSDCMLHDCSGLTTF